MKCRVYIAYGKKGVVLYVGCSQDVAKRIVGHRTLSPWYSKVVEWKRGPPLDRPAALLAEKAAILKLKPRHNIACVPNKPPRWATFGARPKSEKSIQQWRERRIEMQKMVDQNISMTEIARMFKVTRQRVQQILAKT